MEHSIERVKFCFHLIHGKALTSGTCDTGNTDYLRQFQLPPRSARFSSGRGSRRARSDESRKQGRDSGTAMGSSQHRCVRRRQRQGLIQISARCAFSTDQIRVQVTVFGESAGAIIIAQLLLNQTFNLARAAVSRIYIFSYVMVERPYRY